MATRGSSGHLNVFRLSFKLTRNCKAVNWKKNTTKKQRNTMNAAVQQIRSLPLMMEMQWGRVPRDLRNTRTLCLWARSWALSRCQHGPWRSRFRSRCSGNSWELHPARGVTISDEAIAERGGLGTNKNSHCLFLKFVSTANKISPIVALIGKTHFDEHVSTKPTQKQAHFFSVILGNSFVHVRAVGMVDNYSGCWIPTVHENEVFIIGT